MERLQQMRSDLCEDVMFHAVAPSLISADLLNRDELLHIQKHKSDRRRMELFLDNLSSKGPEAIKKFAQVLSKDYGWLAERLLQPQPTTSSDCNIRQVIVEPPREEYGYSQKVTPTKQIVKRKKKIRINKDIIKVLRKNFQVAQKWTTLAHHLDLDNHIFTIRRNVNVYCEDPNNCINYLMQEWMSQYPKTATLGNLISALRDNNFNKVADELEEKFVEKR